MNKFGIAIVVACLMALTAGTVSADPFTDQIVFPDNYTPGGIVPAGRGHKLVQGDDPLCYEHDLLNALPVGVNVPAGDIVNSAVLTLTFWDQGYDNWGEGYCERVDVTFNSGAGVWNLGEVVNYGNASGWQAYDFEENILVTWLNDNDGILAVCVEVYNNDNGWWIFSGRDADVWLACSTLSGDYTVVPVPGAVLLGVLGLGAAGMKLRRRNAA